ncbi:hypothetical protein BZG13_10165 [Salinivibrio sp. ML323]|uniref:hypothetical protein n=1 Tax=unclassified Salinivibrio TaxID=2636825 RepID=UPI0009845075|nr:MULTISPECIES: hypothetical protein [unclassified Salinivibrio]OOE57596.1 hypothetical protein BZG13_10165 [Salinivibrio sp. ML323]OOE66432.1 hypothetical protein BZG14_05075 [Salinivibrio sp. IB282]
MSNTIQKTAIAAAITLASTTSFAGELGSLTSEVKVNDFENGKTDTEVTIGKGTYKLSDDYRFFFDVDKDFIKSEGKSRKEGWDTEFALLQSIGTLGDFDASLNYFFRYDSAWKASDGSDSWDAKQYIFQPYFSKDVSLGGKDFSFGIELWAQLGNKNDGSLKNLSGAETNFYLSGDLSEHWNLSLAWYNFNYYHKAADGYQYQIGTEDYLTYSLPLTDNVSFNVETMLDALHIPEREKTTAEVHIQPQVEFKKQVNDNFSWHAGVTYEALNWDYKDVKGTADDRNAFDDNEFEAYLGFTIK